MLRCLEHTCGYEKWIRIRVAGYTGGKGRRLDVKWQIGTKAVPYPCSLFNTGQSTQDRSEEADCVPRVSSLMCHDYNLNSPMAKRSPHHADRAICSRRQVAVHSEGERVQNSAGPSKA